MNGICVRDFTHPIACCTDDVGLEWPQASLPRSLHHRDTGSRGGTEGTTHSWTDRRTLPPSLRNRARTPDVVVGVCAATTVGEISPITSHVIHLLLLLLGP